MVKLRSPNVDWIDEAMRLSDVFVEKPVGTIQRLAGLAHPVAWEPVHKAINRLKVRVGIRLAYDLQISHKAKTNVRAPRGMDAFYLVFFGENYNAPDLQRQLEDAIGVKLTRLDITALEVVLELRQIVTNRFISQETIRLLPLKVASLGGKFTGETSKIRAERRRTRQPNELQKAKLRAQANSPDSSWKELLTWLTGDEVVEQWDEEEINWIDTNGNSRMTKTGTFRNWKKRPRN